MKTVSLFYATGNPSKLHNMAYRLREHPIRLLSPRDTGLSLAVEETGATAVENALLKARAYYEAVHLPTIAGDSGMILEGVDASDQPGLFVRRADGRSLTDEELLRRYTALAEKAAGPVWLTYFTGLALITERGVFTAEIPDVRLRLCAVPSPSGVRPGFPLDSVSLTEDGRYYCDLTDEERRAYNAPSEQAFTDFILSHLGLT